MAKKRRSRGLGYGPDEHMTRASEQIERAEYHLERAGRGRGSCAARTNSASLALVLGARADENAKAANNKNAMRRAQSIAWAAFEIIEGCAKA